VTSAHKNTVYIAKKIRYLIPKFVQKTPKYPIKLKRDICVQIFEFE